ncbi:MAG: carboxylating nicotinate-nucleotide diphosphorylase [Chloroflexi bacterium]|nr:carboxylating nicotinate-nucleotide diphosphorylase [Chloroflexota bacterium]
MEALPALLPLIDAALAEDAAADDVTTAALIPPGLRARGVIAAKAPGVLAGGPVAQAVFLRVDPALAVELVTAEGATLTPGQTVMTIAGAATPILRAERTALNFLQRMSGIATETARYVAAVAGTRARILDTRKTAPGLRALDKYAVRMGGGQNHRQNLSDGILIKDNHLAALRTQGVGVAEAVRRARERAPRGLKLEVEVTSVELAIEAAAAGADILLLDNMPLPQMREAARKLKGRCLLEASGSITLENVRAVAEAGVDFISVGALTHSTRALDLSLELEPL